MKKWKSNLPTLMIVLLCLIGSIVFISLMVRQIDASKNKATAGSVHANRMQSQDSVASADTPEKNTEKTEITAAQESPVNTALPANEVKETNENVDSATVSAIDAASGDEVQLEEKPSPVAPVGYSSKKDAEKSVPAKPILTPPPAPGSKPTPTPAPKATPTPLPRTTVPDSENPFLTAPDGKPVIEDGTTEYGENGTGDKF